MSNNSARLGLLFTCLLFGTLGTITRFIELPSSALCCARAVLAVVTILVWLLITGQKADVKSIRANLKTLIILGLLMSANWICQFEAFNHTTIAISTVCYYTQPIFLVIGATLFLKEKLSKRKVICILVAFIGIALVSGIGGDGLDARGMVGLIYAIAGAILYASIVLINKNLKDISPIDSTMTQLGFAAIIVFPYVLLTEDLSAVHMSTLGIGLLILIGVLHTGIAYVIYFASVKKLNAATVGIISYIDPVVAVLLSIFFLKEPITITIIIGAVLILGATAVSELTGNRDKQ